jgi:hypothetical protein
MLFCFGNGQAAQVRSKASETKTTTLISEGAAKRTESQTPLTPIDPRSLGQTRNRNVESLENTLGTGTFPK